KTYAEYLSEVKEMVLTSFVHESYQYEDLIDSLSLDRGTSRNPLFDVMFSYFKEEEVAERNSLSGLISAYEDEEPRSSSKFDMTMVVVEQPEQIAITLTYSTSLFVESSIKRFLTYFEQLVDTVLLDPNLVIGDLGLLTKEEQYLQVSKYQKDYIENTTSNIVTEIFKGKVKSYAQDTAIVSDINNLSYKELDELSNQMAQYLIDSGVKKGDYVPIAMSRGVEMIIGIFGVLKMGGVYVPIDPNFPVERILYILKDVTASVLISDVSDMEFEEVEILSVNKYKEYSKQEVNESIEEKDLAYIIYTSGSTGKPKGVKIHHGALSSFLYAMHDTYPLEKEDRLMFKTAFTFDVSVLELFGWLFSGASLYIASDKIQLSPLKMLSSIKDNRVTHLTLVPSVFGVLLDALEKTNDLSLKYIFLAGEALPITMVKRYSKLNLTTKLINLYGPTETTIYCSHFVINDESDLTKNIPIGRPLCNSCIYIVDAYGNVVPEGVTGELYIGGSGVSRGYLNRPKLTKKSFVDNPYRKGEKMYASGDLGRWLSDGTIEFIGRKDSQVKIRGYRIELGEIINQVESHAEVGQSVVRVQGSGNDKYLVCYYTSTTGIESSELESYLQEILP
ncbi:amino acid adenylation domain-containing protein, partial [uncultured Tenacibaculum sp.]